MSTRHLNLESCMSPPNCNVTFLEERIVMAEFRNISPTDIEILEVSCRFAAEEGMSPTEHRNSEPVRIPPKHAKTVSINVKFGLELAPHTNFCKLSVKFKSGSSPEPKEETFTKWHVIIYAKRDPDPVVELFVSHKDPEDTPMAMAFKRHLKKIGLRGFVAEEDVRPGVRLWEGKIHPAIDRCKALIVLWTKKSRNSASIRDEIRYAKQQNKPIILIMEEGLNPPRIIPGDTERLQVGQFTDSEIIGAVGSINATYESGGYEPNP